MYNLVGLPLLVFLAMFANGDSGIDDTDRQEAEAYLRRYGYLASPMAEQLSKLTHSNDSFKTAVASFQDMAGLEITGSKWPKTVLTYNFTNPTRPTLDLSASETKQEIARAFKLWTDVAALRLSESQTKVADMQIRFVAGDHGDGHPFDGPGRSLAHAFFAGSGGNLHFDEDETWTAGGTGAYLLAIAAHELGHSLGLAHSKVLDAVMSPYVKGYITNFTLHADDIEGIQSIYGSKPSTELSERKQPKPQKQAPSIWCLTKTLKFDAIFSIDIIAYVFMGKEYVQLDQYGVVPGYPKDISATWRGLPSDLDAELFWSSNLASYTQDHQSGTVYFFKGTQCWLYTSQSNKTFSMAPDFPKKISDVFHGIPNDLNAAFVWSGNGRAYFIKGNQYYRFKSGIGVYYGFPRPLSTWKGLPDTVDAVFYSRSPRRTFFFKDGVYFRFNDIKFKVDAGYPLPIAQT